MMFRPYGAMSSGDDVTAPGARILQTPRGRAVNGSRVAKM